GRGRRDRHPELLGVQLDESGEDRFGPHRQQRRRYEGDAEDRRQTVAVQRKPGEQGGQQRFHGPASLAIRAVRSDMPIDYLKRILTARVYDVAEETSLEPAENLSARIGNRVLLKREDMQPVFS